MIKTFSCACAVTVAAVASLASNLRADETTHLRGPLTTAVYEYHHEADRVMAASWSEKDDTGIDGQVDSSAASRIDSCVGVDACTTGGCAAPATCGNRCGDTSCLCCCDPGGFCDNLELFVAGDGWANHGDDDDTNNFGYRLGTNSGFGGDTIRFQAGASYGFYNLHGREDEPNDTGSEGQLFLTGGIYKRSNVCCGDRWAAGVVYDYMRGHNWGEGGDDLDLSQIRALFGYALSRRNELGVWMAFGLDTDTVPQMSSTVIVQAKDQVNLFWRHQFEYGAQSMFYVGLADEPNGVNPNIYSPDLREVVLGFRGQAPLNRWLALYGNVLYILPGTSGGDNSNDSYAEEVWNVSVGLVFYPGAKARSNSVSGPAGLPLIPVADNGTFAVNTPAGNL
ncbi:MAG: DUF6666 family protein [Pirellulales bacterium]|nr:hypothetical protein [Planctomycetales bacterium]